MLLSWWDSLSFVIYDLLCTTHGHTLYCIDKTNICFVYITIMHLNIEALLNAFRFPLSGPANRKSDSVMIQNICICLLMQFKMSMVKYSERNCIFKPFWAPGPTVGLCRHTGSGSHVAVLCSGCPSTGSLSLAQSFHPQLTLKAFSALFLLSCFIIVQLDLHVQGVVCKISTQHFKEL